MSDEEVDIKRLHDLWRKPWWPVAKAILATGYDCLVLDPDAREPAEWSDGLAVVSVVPHPGLGWSVIVTECEPDVEDDPE